MQKVLKLILAISPFIVTSVFAFILWRFIFKLLFKLQGDFSVDIRKKVMPDIQQANNYLITLSSSAILLTFFILQKLDRSVFYKNFLIISWIGFTFCILIGVIIVIATYVFKSHYLITTHEAENLVAEKDAGEKRNHSKKVFGLVREAGKFEKSLFALLFFQPIIFFFSVVYLVLFAIKNI